MLQPDREVSGIEKADESREQLCGISDHQGHSNCVILGLNVSSDDDGDSEGDGDGNDNGDVNDDSDSDGDGDDINYYQQCLR